MRRTQARNYVRILQQSNTPGYWYKTPPTNRSVYFYDTNYQKYVQQRITSPQRIKPNIRVNHKLFSIIFTLLVLANFSSIITSSRTFA